MFTYTRDSKVFKGKIHYCYMKFYNGLPKEKVLEIHSFVIDKRKGGGFGQRKLYRLVREKFGVEVKENTIAGWIFRKIVPYNNEKTQFKAKPKPSKEELYESYINQKQSAEKLGKKYDVSTIIVINWLRFYGIATRTHLESMNTEGIKRELRELKLRKPTKEFSNLSPEKAYLLAVLSGDGHLGGGNIRLEIRKDEEFIKEFSNCLEKVYGLKFRYYYYPKRRSFILNASCECVYNDLLKYGKFGTFEWRVPKEILESNDEKVICSFLRGIYDSEGCATRCALSLSSANKRGIEDVGLLLKRLGIESKICCYKGKYYVLWIFRKGRFKIFREKVGFTIKRKMNKIDETLNTGFFSKRSVAN